MSNEDKKVIESLKHIPVDQIKSLPWFQNRGHHFIDRALIQDKQGARELVFSDTIKKLYESNNLPDSFRMCETHEELVFTVFQWLTTNCGRSALEEAFNKTDIKMKFDY